MSDERIAFTVDGTPYDAPAGQTVAAALIDHGIVAWRRTRFADRPRGVLCGIGVCFDCLITVNGQANVRACMTDVRRGDDVQTQKGTGHDA